MVVVVVVVMVVVVLMLVVMANYRKLSALKPPKSS